MKAAFITGHGGNEVVEYGEFPTPEPEHGNVLVKMKAAALNRRAEERRREFLGKVQPILLEILSETGADAVVDRRFVLIFKQDLNITDEVIKRLDEAYLAEGGGQGAQDEQDN